MAEVKFQNFLLRVVLVAILTALIGSVISYVVGLFSGIGVLSSLVTAIFLAGIFIWVINAHSGTESFLEAIPVVLISASLVEFLRTWVPAIPSVITEFSWTSLAILLSSIYVSDMIVKKYIL